MIGVKLPYFMYKQSFFTPPPRYSSCARMSIDFNVTGGIGLNPFSPRSFTIGTHTFGIQFERRRTSCKSKQEMPRGTCCCSCSGSSHRAGGCGRDCALSAVVVMLPGSRSAPNPLTCQYLLSRLTTSFWSFIQPRACGILLKKQSQSNSCSLLSRYPWAHAHVYFSSFSIHPCNDQYLTTSSFSNRQTTTSSCPLIAASVRGVQPNISLWFGSTSSCSNSNATISKCPWAAAKESGVQPKVSKELASTCL